MLRGGDNIGVEGLIEEQDVHVRSVGGMAGGGGDVDGGPNPHVGVGGGIEIQLDGPFGGVIAGYGGKVVGLHLLNTDDRAGGVDEDDVERDAGVFHVEGEDLLVGEDENHSVIGGHGVASHEAVLAGCERV